MKYWYLYTGLRTVLDNMHNSHNQVSCPSGIYLAIKFSKVNIIVYFYFQLYSFL